MRTRLITLAAGLGLAVALAACGSDDPVDAGSTVAVDDGGEAQTQNPTPDAAPATIDVLAGETNLGGALVGPDGRTLYGFTNDIDAISTCYGTCADAWPPVIVTDDWTAGPGLDFGIFATTVREDGQRQLVAGRWPLYWFAGDAAPGDINGQGSGDVWFAVDLGGALIQDASAPSPAAQDDPAATERSDDPDEADSDGGDDPDDSSGYGGSAMDQGGAAEATAPVVAGSTDLGEVLVDQSGLTLYGFTNDRDATGSNCNGPCADAWPPVIVEGDGVPAGLDQQVFSVVTRDDGTNQLAAGVWPLYRFAGDGGPGDTNGQGSGGVWFAVDPVGGLIGAP